MSEQSKRLNKTIDYYKEDEEFLGLFLDDVYMLAGMAIEMMETNPQTLLSPIFRKSLADRARQVQSRLLPLKDVLAINSLEDPLKAVGS